MGDETRFRELLQEAAALEGEELELFLKGLPAPVRRGVEEEWGWQAHGGQMEPEGEWRTWLIQAGRGFGKTRAGAEWVWARAREAGTLAGDRPLRIALVTGNSDDLYKVMVFGDSGLMAAARAGEKPRWVASREMLIFPSGAMAIGYSAETPDKLRGPQHHFAWCDELAKWPRAEETWNNLKMGLRLGTRPRAVVTTTPRPMALLKRIAALGSTEVTRGRTTENVHLTEEYQDEMQGLYGRSRLGRQELEGELIEDYEGALWTRALIEACRVGDSRFSRGGSGLGAAGRESDCPMARVVIGVDPPASADGDACGIVVCGLAADPDDPWATGTGHVLADLSVAGLSPQGWAAKVAAAAEAWSADRVVAEANNGGAMVETVLRGACVTLPVRLVHASQGKSARAEPVAALFESGRVKLAGAFPELEDQLCGLLAGGRYAGPGRSPDRADAMVWALTELMLGKPRGRPRLTIF